MSGIILKNQAGKRDLRDLAVVATEDLSEEVAALLELTSTHITARAHLPPLRIYIFCVYLFGFHFPYPSSLLLYDCPPSIMLPDRIEYLFHECCSPIGVLP